MRITRFEFADEDVGWSLLPVDFHPDLTLLVGVSGVGKSRILGAIQTVKGVAEAQKGLYPWGVSWRIEFSRQGSEFTWEGRFQSRSSDDDDVSRDHLLIFPEIEMERRPKPTLESESLTRDGREIARRDGDEIFFEGKSTPKLAADESVVSILKREESIAAVSEGFRRILNVDHSDRSSSQPYIVQSFEKLCHECKDLDAIRASSASTFVKVAVAQRTSSDAFQSVISRFKEVFPTVEDVDCRVEKLPFGEFVTVRMKERRVAKWIPHARVSSGMMRTLLHLARMEFWPSGMVLLIDEFENSLGANCIDQVTDRIVEESRRMQTILTSHHPYVINNIPSTQWKLVRRSGGVVRVVDAAEIGIGRSSHEAFFELINSPDFEEGIELDEPVHPR